MSRNHRTGKDRDETANQVSLSSLLHDRGILIPDQTHLCVVLLEPDDCKLQVPIAEMDSILPEWRLLLRRKLEPILIGEGEHSGEVHEKTDDLETKIIELQDEQSAIAAQQDLAIAAMDVRNAE
ncbi:hypothetical protein N7528_007302 [Penicillium herquei]|nr:hypothetical protein N7528_007302 [Penicillium herquei]